MTLAHQPFAPRIPFGFGGGATSFGLSLLPRRDSTAARYHASFSRFATTTAEGMSRRDMPARPTRDGPS